MATASGIEALDIELLAQILEYVDDTSPSTTKSVALVNRFFRDTSKLVSYRYRKVTYRTDDEDMPDLKPWLDNELILRGLRYLQVAEDKNSGSVKVGRQSRKAKRKLEGQELLDHKWGELTALIKKLGNLKTLIWTYRHTPPIQILEALYKYHRKAELKILNWERQDWTAGYNVPEELALCDFPLLTSFKSTIWNLGRSAVPDLRMVAFKRIVARAPNLRYASVVTGRSGCVIVSDQNIDQKVIDRFMKHDKPNSSVRALTLDGFALSNGTLNEWSKIVDLSQLESFKCSRGIPDLSYFLEGPKRLTNLKHISLNLGGLDDRNMKTAVENYITTCNPLQTLSLWSWIGIVPLSTILARHGSALHTLQLHERETLIPPNEAGSRKLLTLDDVREIKNGCPNLKDLSIDLARESHTLEETDSYKDLLNELSSMGLNKLQIYFDLGLPSIRTRSFSVYTRRRPNKRSKTDENNTSWMIPSTNTAIKPFVEKLWKTIFGDQRTGQRLLHVKFGEWERKMGVGYPANWVISEQSLRTFWIISPDVRDDRKGECVVEKKGDGFEPKEVDIEESSEDDEAGADHDNVTE